MNSQSSFYPRCCFKKIPGYNVTGALTAHRAICDIVNALKSGNYQRLAKMTGVRSLPP